MPARAILEAANRGAAAAAAASRVARRPAVGVDDVHRPCTSIRGPSSDPAGSAPGPASSVACSSAPCWAVPAVAGSWSNPSPRYAQADPDVTESVAPAGAARDNCGGVVAGGRRHAASAWATASSQVEPVRGPRPSTRHERRRLLLCRSIRGRQATCPAASGRGWARQASRSRSVAVGGVVGRTSRPHVVGYVRPAAGGDVEALEEVDGGRNGPCVRAQAAQWARQWTPRPNLPADAADHQRNVRDPCRELRDDRAIEVPATNGR